jgi:hypothetical protein
VAPIPVCGSTPLQDALEERTLMRKLLPLAFLLLPTLSFSQASVTELRDSCTVYVKVAHTPLAELSARDAASSGLCMGYFKGFMSAVQGSVTEPDADGHIKQFNIKDGTTFNQAIGVFLALVRERPEFLKEDAVVVINASLMASGLATLENKPVTYVKKR